MDMRKIFGILMVIGLISCEKKKESTFPTQGPISESIYASGTLKSQNQYQAFVTISGVIDQFFVKEGDTVQAGDPILLIANQAQKLNTENAQLAAKFADLGENKSKLIDAKNTIEFTLQKFKLDSSIYQRQKMLWSQQVGTRIDLEQKELSQENSKINYLAALQKYRDLKRQIDFTSAQSRKNVAISAVLQQDFILKSKMNGVVFSIKKEKGEMVNPQSAVAIIGNPQAYLLEMQVDENDIFKIKMGALVLINLDSYKNQLFEAKVSTISSIMNERSKTFLVEAEFIKKPPKMFPFMTFEANIVLQTKIKSLLVPRNYLIGDTLITLKNGETKRVQTGLKDFQKIEILSGISVTDEIIKP